jgi:hypothetical protein
MFVLHKQSVNAVVKTRRWSITYQKQSEALLKAMEASISSRVTFFWVFGRTLVARRAREAVRALRDMVVRGSWGKNCGENNRSSHFAAANFLRTIDLTEQNQMSEV